MLRRSSSTTRAAAAIIAAGLAASCGAPAAEPELGGLPPVAAGDEGGDQSPTKYPEREVEAPTESEAQAAIAAAQSAPIVIVAHDDTIELPIGGTWAYHARVSEAPTPAACLENVGSSVTCRAIVPGGPDVEILGYGGAPVPVVAAWSATDHTEVAAVLADGSTATARFVNTEVGSFAALPFSAAKPPVSLHAVSPTAGEAVLGLAEFVGGDADSAAEGADY